jgi:hypothetical protein
MTKGYRDDYVVLVSGNNERHAVEVHEHRGGFSVRVPTWLNGHGLHLFVGCDDGKDTYSTGLHPYDSGSSGPIVFGAEELAQFLRLVLS